MNAAEIRELAIDRATDAMLGKVYRLFSFAVPETERDAAREIATWVVDGLGDLLPTSASYGAATEPIGKRWLAERADEPAARYLATRANAIPVRRYVGDWHELGDVNGEVHAILDLDLVRVTPEAEQ